MPRKVPEWKGKTPDSRPPWSVIERLLEKQDHKCNGPCQQPIGPGNPYDVDHIIELKDGGENREGNLQLLCRKICHHDKSTKRQVARARETRKRKKNSGYKGTKRKWPGHEKWKRMPDGRVVRREEK